LKNEKEVMQFANKSGNTIPAVDEADLDILFTHILQTHNPTTFPF